MLLCFILKKMENEGSFNEFIEILKNEPNAEEIYNIFFILSNAFPYIHSGYFKENSKIIKDSLIKFINNLDNKEIRNLPKDLIDIISDLLKKFKIIILMKIVIIKKMKLWICMKK